MGRRLPKTISQEEFLQLVAGVKHTDKDKVKKIKAAFVLGFYQCMRISEVLDLKQEHIDKSRGFLHLLQAKGNKDRDIPIQKPIIKFLKHIPIGIPKRTLQRILTETAQRVLGKHLTFHHLRHSGATFYLNSGLDIRHLQALLGHARIGTTEIYTHVTSTGLKKITDKLWEGI